jgi:hypothetical protein
MVSKFWLLRAPGIRGLAEEAPGIDYEGIACPTNDGHKRGGRRKGELSVILHPMGVKDFTWTWLSDILVSQRVLSLFEKHHVTGFQARRAKTAYPSAIKTPPPDLFELVVTGWGGLAAAAASVKVVKSCLACGLREYSIAEPNLLIDAAAWDGSDLFIVWPLPRFRFASDRLASILRQERVSGIKLVPAPKIPMARGNKVSPGGSLTLFMPEERARELEQRFGIL